MQFTLLELTMNDTCNGMNFNPPHLINVATLPVKSKQ